jgi:hypothetical protein
LNLEKIYLLVQSVMSSYKPSSSSQQLKYLLIAHLKDEDEVEKRISKEKRKGLLAVEKALSSIHFELQLDKSDQADRMARASSTEHFHYVDYDRRFADLIRVFIIRPFGKALNQDLQDLFT